MNNNHLKDEHASSLIKMINRGSGITNLQFKENAFSKEISEKIEKALKENRDKIRRSFLMGYNERLGNQSKIFSVLRRGDQKNIANLIFSFIGVNTIEIKEIKKDSEKNTVTKDTTKVVQAVKKRKVESQRFV